MMPILPTGQDKARSCYGFSLVELLVVLTIISILVSSISFVVINKQDNLNSTVTHIIQQLRLIQQQAIRDDQPYQVEINLGDNQISFVDDFVELSEEVAITVRTAENQIINDQVVGVTFYPDGSSSGGTITLESGNDLFEISIVWISGKIELQQRTDAT